MTADIKHDKESITEPKKYGLGLRHIQFLLLFAITVIDYGIRTNMSVGIIAMIDKNHTQTNPDIPTYPDWTMKNEIISAFFWGYVVLQIGAGALVKRFGPKWPLIVSTIINSTATILIPVMAKEMGQIGVILCRIFQGLSQGFLYPSMHHMIGKWASASERSIIVSSVYTGGPLGNVISLPVTGWIAASSVGWPVSFYLYGAMGLGWALLFTFIGASSPAEHKGISLEERRFIEGNKEIEDLDKKMHEPTPWKEILTSLPFWAIFVAHSGQNWGFWTLLSEIPSYMENMMKFEISKNSLLSALPYFVLWILSFGFSPLADYIIMKGYLSIGNTRKVMQSIGVIIPAITLTCLAFVDSDDKTLAIALLVVAVGINAAVFSGFNVNHIDLSPNHAGVLMGITNSLSNIFSIVAPLALDMIPREESDPILWRYVFLIAAAIYVVSDIFFVIFASGEIQPWNSIHTKTIQQSEKV